MANAKSMFSNAAPVLASGVAGAALGHFAGKGKNLLLGAALVLGADVIASKLPKSINASHLRIAGATAMVVTPSAPTSSNQSVSSFAKDGLNRLKGFANSAVMGAGVKQAPFSLAQAATVEGYGYIGEADYEYVPNQVEYPEVSGYIGEAYDESNAGR